MTEHFVTLFDYKFLPQGLALHSSLMQHHPDPMLWVICMDARTHETLEGLGLPRIRLIGHTEIETPRLLEIKPTRSTVEYYWTLTPHTPRAVFERDSKARRVTYVDADLYFLRDPSALIRELEEAGKSVLITEHAYDPVYDRSRTHGRFCVQFMTFAKDRSEHVRTWWQERCEEWCFARVEDGKYGDQKYLDSWPTLFPDEVHVLEAVGALLAPWNARRFPMAGATAWHFHGLRLLGNGRALMYRDYLVPQVVVKHIYRPYLRQLQEQLDRIGFDVIQKTVGPGYLLLSHATEFLKVLGRSMTFVFNRLGKVARLS